MNLRKKQVRSMAKRHHARRSRSFNLQPRSQTQGGRMPVGSFGPDPKLRFFIDRMNSIAPRMAQSTSRAKEKFPSPEPLSCHQCRGFWFNLKNPPICDSIVPSGVSMEAETWSASVAWDESLNDGCSPSSVRMSQSVRYDNGDCWSMVGFPRKRIKWVRI
jgi:hypothetical protein